MTRAATNKTGGSPQLTTWALIPLRERRTLSTAADDRPSARPALRPSPLGITLGTGPPASAQGQPRAVAAARRLARGVFCA
jgi:hypothetical protein